MSSAERTVYLRVDVEFHEGLRKAVPHMLELFEELGIQATFLVVMGHDTLHRHAARVRQRSFRQRIRAMNPARVLYHMGSAYVKSRLLSLQVAGAFPEHLRAIVERGHELGPHGYDHALWADRCYEMSIAETRREMALALESYHSLLGVEPQIWAAPNWRVNDHMFRVLDEYGIQYSSDVRGVQPFRPVIDGRPHRALQLPVTLPCLHELIQAGIPRVDAPRVIESCSRSDYNLLCTHDYYEGLLERRLFRTVLEHLLERGWRFRPLRDAWLEWSPRASRAGSALSRVNVPGGARSVSCDARFLEQNYFAAVAETTA